MPPRLARLPRIALGLAAACALLVGTACSRAGAPQVMLPGICADWFRLAAESTKFAPGGPQPDALRTSVESTTVYLQALAGNAPPEVRADFTTYAEWWADFSKQMARVEYDFTKVAGDTEIQRAMTATTEPRFTQASANISAWVQEHCTSTSAAGTGAARGTDGSPATQAR